MCRSRPRTLDEHQSKIDDRDGWAWVKGLVGLSVFEATLVIDSAVLDALLRSERNTLLLLIAVTVANVVLAVWRPRLTYKVR